MGGWVGEETGDGGMSWKSLEIDGYNVMKAQPTTSSLRPGFPPQIEGW